MIRTLFRARVRVAAACLLLACSAPSHALKILLVNDDGCTAPGINVLADALQAAGYHIDMYAPASDQSGQGTRLTLINRGCPRVTFDIGDTDLSGTRTTSDDRRCVSAVTHDCSAPLPLPFTADGQRVSASPVDSALVGLQLLSGVDKPDLVISGINRGENVGLTTNNSGTVSAAVTAIRHGIPAIAVSLGIPAPDARYPEVAKFVVAVVARLQKNAKSGPLLPAGMGLNINYPGAGTPKGVLFTHIGNFTTIELEPRLQKDGSVALGITADLKPQGLPADKIKDEGVALREGYISISTLDGNWEGTPTQDADSKNLLKGITP